MQSTRQCECNRKDLQGQYGIALVSLESQREGSLLTLVLEHLQGKPSFSNVCLYNSVKSVGELSECLSRHKAVLLIDSTNNGTAIGTVSITDLRAMLSRSMPTAISSSHGALIASELSSLTADCLPQRIILLGVESPLETKLHRVNNTGNDQAAVGKVSILVSIILETLIISVAA